MAAMSDPQTDQGGTVRHMNDAPEILRGDIGRLRRIQKRLGLCDESSAIDGAIRCIERELAALDAPPQAPPDLRQTLEPELFNWLYEIYLTELSNATFGRKTGQRELAEHHEQRALKFMRILEHIRLPHLAPSALEAKAEWQPIETAPKDGTVFLGTRWHVTCGQWITDTARWSSHGPGASTPGDYYWLHGGGGLTHWQPLPPPPSREDTRP